MTALAAVPAPPHRRVPFEGPEHTIREMRAAVMGPRGEGSPVVHNAVSHVVRQLQPKDYLSEILAVRHWCAEHVRYKNDPVGVEYVQDPQRMLDDIAKYGTTTGDCFPEGTLVLRDDHRLVPVEQLEVGDRIWGHEEWVDVEGVAPKGNLPVSVVVLNNGSQLALTEDHHVYVMHCDRHGHDTTNCTHQCAVRHAKERLRVSELEHGMALPVPDRIPFGREQMDPGLALVDGLYVADGWSEPSRFFISGQDGCPKEEQKRAAERIAHENGSSTRWHRKYLAVNDRDWAQRMAQMGKQAPEKHLLSIDLDEATAAATLRGIMADSAAHTNGKGRTFTTTSRELMVQARVLHRMFGLSCRYSFNFRHGGLGTHPIYRLGVRNLSDAGRSEKLLRVLDIEREMFTGPVWDIQTSDHHVYLPEHDVTVSQCDDIATLMAAMLRCLGRETQFVTVGFGAPGKYSHVFVRAQEPKSKQWVVCDPVAGTNEDRMLSRVSTWKTWPVD